MAFYYILFAAAILSVIVGISGQTTQKERFYGLCIIILLIGNLVIRNVAKSAYEKRDDALSLSLDIVNTSYCIKEERDSLLVMNTELIDLCKVISSQRDDMLIQLDSCIQSK